MKLSDKKALELLEGLPLEEVSNEANFLAPLHTTGQTASILCDDVNYGRRLVAGQLGTDNVWWEYEMDKATHKVRVTGTVTEKSTVIKGVS